MNKTIITAFAFGVLATILTFQIYVNWQFQAAWNADHQTLASVVGFLNQNVKNNTPATK